MATQPVKRSVTRRRITPASQAASRGRPRNHDENPDRRDIILDAGEALFSMHGFHGVAVREIAKEAGVDPALLNYYFKSKRGVFDAVFERRAEIVNEQRLQSLARYRDSTVVLTVEGCLQAFFEPVLHKWEQGGDGWRNYLRLVALINNTPAWGGQTIARYFDPVIQKLIEMLQKALPRARLEDLYWCYQFVSGALLLCIADTGRIDNLSGGLCRSGDVAAVRKRLAFFLAAGTSELCNRLAEAAE